MNSLSAISDWGAPGQPVSPTATPAALLCENAVEFAAGICLTHPPGVSDPRARRFPPKHDRRSTTPHPAPPNQALARPAGSCGAVRRQHRALVLRGRAVVRLARLRGRVLEDAEPPERHLHRFR